MVQGTLQNLLLLLLVSVTMLVCRLAVCVFMLTTLTAITSDLHTLKQSILFFT
jgi:hypothetical protein